MIIDFAEFTKSLSVALDFAEKELIGVSPDHGIRVAVIADRMAEYLGAAEDIRFSLIQAAMLHDCALSEYMSDELSGNGQTSPERDMAAHCVAGEEILEILPFYDRVKGAVLFHHERADGKGALGKKADETPQYAQLIHIADAVDVRFSLYSCSKDRFNDIRLWVQDNSNTVFSDECAAVFLESVDFDLVESVSGGNARKVIGDIIHENMIDVPVEALREMASVFAKITDYKSHFTWRHSMGIAEKAETMGHYYRLSDEECSKLFIAGALHDIGKLLTSNDILEKPGRLSPEEYREIQNHAMGTWELLHNISGMEDITRWAAFHHEKLDGSGYPFGYKDDRLDRNSRLMACLDIYQALVEDRPYKAGMSHDEAMAILSRMGNSGQLDTGIISDIGLCFQA